MKAFHLGAFEVMVVTDDRLSESGGGGGAFMRFCVHACARFFAAQLFEHRATIDGAVAFMDSDRRKAAVGQRGLRGAV